MRISNRIASATPLATTAMHGRVDRMKLNGEEVIDFSVAISHFAAPEAVRHESGPYIWVDVSALGCDTIDFSERLLTEKRVAIMPGDALGTPGFIRMGFISDDIGTLRKGMASIIAFGNAMTSNDR